MHPVSLVVLILALGVLIVFGYVVGVLRTLRRKVVALELKVRELESKAIDEGQRGVK